MRPYDGTFLEGVPPDQLPASVERRSARTVAGEGPEIHELAVVESPNQVGPGTRIWRWTLVRDNCPIGMDCNIGSHVIVGPDVLIADFCKVEDGAKLYGPLTVMEGVIIGPGAVVTNDKHPSARTRKWKAPGPRTVIEEGASIGANAVIMPGVRIGAGAVIGAGCVVTTDVPPGETWVGVPGRWVSRPVEPAGPMGHIGPMLLAQHYKEMGWLGPRS